jgi:lysophospholipase L1-like esterase
MVREDFEAFTRVVHEVLPETRIVFISIKPSPQRWALRSKMRAANQQIRAVAERDPRITFVNVASLMLGADGEPRAELFQADGLHLSAAGYRLWSSLLRPHLE